MAGRGEAAGRAEGPRDLGSEIGGRKTESYLETTGDLVPVYHGEGVQGQEGLSRSERDMEAEEKAPIEMMIARDNWKWMPARQASRLTERQDKEKIRDKRLLARTQFGKRLLLLPCVEASEVVPPEEDKEEWYTERGVSPTATTRMLDQEEKEDAQWIERRAQEFCGHAEVHRRRAENRRRSGAWRSRPRELVSRKLTRARATLVGVIPMLTASLAGLAGVEGF